MNYWFFINLILLLYALGLFIFTKTESIYGSVAVFFAIIGLAFILFNWNMHAIFSKIRSLKSRDQRIKIAKKARKIMPCHVWIGFTALALIILHILFVFRAHGVSFVELKMVSGVITFIGLLAVIISGWMRRKKATGKRRRAHLYLAMTLFYLMVFHILIEL